MTKSHVTNRELKAYPPIAAPVTDSVRSAAGLKLRSFCLRQALVGGIELKSHHEHGAH